MQKVLKNKDSGFRWLRQIPEEWDVSKVKYCFTRKNSKAEEENPVVLSLARDGVKIRDITTNEGQLAESYYNYNPVEPGDMLINPMDLYSGANCSLSKVSGVISPAYINLKNKIGLESRFFDYYFKYQYWSFAFFSYGKGVSYDNRWTLNDFSLMNFPLLVPSLDEQTRIADFLDSKCQKIDDTIEKINKQIEVLKKYKQSFITEVVTKGLDKNVGMKNTELSYAKRIPKHWKVIKFKYLGEYRNGLTYSPLDICDENEGTLVLRSSNIQNSCLSLDDNVYVRTEVPDELKVKKGDILICSRNGSRELIGKNALINDINATFGAFMMIYRTKEYKYLYYILNSDIFKSYLGVFFTSTINQLTGQIFGNMKIPYCFDKNEVDEMIEYLDLKCSKIDTILDKKSKQIEILEQYKKSLIYEYVTGKKKVK